VRTRVRAVIVLVTGTGTDVGKTFVAAALLRALRKRGLTVRARKPVQSFAPGDPTTDADVLAGATGEDANVVCPAHRRLAVPMAPPMAAEALGLPAFTIAQLSDELGANDPDVFTLVEAAGGVRSPLAVDGDTVTLARHVRPDWVVLVADAGLGTINLVRLSLVALSEHRTVVFLNRFDDREDLHRRNAQWLRAREDCHVETSVEGLARALVGSPPSLEYSAPQSTQGDT
jgi:dethiobiotin synthetase